MRISKNEAKEINMRKKSVFIVTTLANWLLFLGCLLVLLSSQYLGPLVPAELANETLFAPYRQLGNALYILIIALFVTAVLNTYILSQNIRTRPAEKAKRRPQSNLIETLP